MNRTGKIVLFVTVFIIAGIVVFGITDREKKGNKNDVTLFFLSSDKSTVLECEKTINADDGQTFYDAVAEALIKGTPGKKYSALTDKSTEVLSIENQDGNLKIDFSEKYSEADLLATYAVIKTFSQFSDVNAVMVTCEGRDVLGRGFISGDEINLESDEDCATTIRLYFADKEKTGLVGEYRKISISDTQPVEQYIVNELSKGSKIDGHIRLLPSGADIVSVETTDGTCYVNFKQGFAEKGSPSKEAQMLMIYSIVNSLTERGGVENVQFLIDGKKGDKIGDTDISAPLYRNEAIIK